MEPEELDALVRRNQASLYQFLRFLGATPPVAEDLAQETFLAAARSDRPPPVTDVAGTATWLRVVARNRFYSHCRREQRNPVAADPEWLAKADTYWATEFVRDDEGAGYRAALRQCLAALPEDQRRALLLRYTERQGRDEMGRALGLSEDGVKSLLRRVRAGLAACVRRRFAEEDR